METLTAQNIFLDENTGGKGRHFTSRFLQPGLVKYSFGVCLLAKETIDKFIYQFVGCPVIINHKDVTNESAKDDRMGVVSRVWFDQMDGWYWCEGIIFEEQAISLIEDGYNVSCQYEITEYSNNTTKALHNGNPYDKVILNGKPEHLAIVKTPRYEAAMIAVNALDLTAENEDKWITIKPNGDDAKGKHLLLKDGETPKEAIDRVYKKKDKEDWENKYRGSKEQRELYTTKINELSKAYLDGDKEKSDYLRAFTDVVSKRRDDEYIKKQKELLGQLKQDKDLYNTPTIKAQIDALTELEKFNNKEKQEGQSDTKDGGEEKKSTFKPVKGIMQSLKDDYEAGKINAKEVAKELSKANLTPYLLDDNEALEKIGVKQSDTKDKQSDSKGDLDIKKTTVKMKSGKEKEIEYVDSVPEGYKKLEGAMTAPLGYTWYHNGKSVIDKERKTILVKDSDTAKNTIVQAINEIKETNMFKNLFNKKEQKMEKDELKEIFMDCIQDVLKAQNEDEEEKKKIDDAENEDEEKEEKAENKKACNEDKRKLIDEVAGMMKSAGCDDEVIRTAIAKMEKIGYDKSEAGTADNGKKAKCEDEEEKEEALNKAKNSIEALKGLISQVDVRKPASKYITKADAIELGNKLF